jgi:hypothetical protein
VWYTPQAPRSNKNDRAERDAKSRVRFGPTRKGSAGVSRADQIVDLSVQILEYPAGQTSPATTLQITDKGEPVAGGVTLDKHGNLFIHAFFIDDPPSRVYEFPHGKTTAKDLHLKGLGDVSGLSGDERGNLYVADANGNISVYAPGQKNATRTVSPPTNNIFDGFVTTRSGKLYVAQGQPGFAPPSLIPALRAAAVWLAYRADVSHRSVPAVPELAPALQLGTPRRRTIR